MRAAQLRNKLADSKSSFLWEKLKKIAEESQFGLPAEFKFLGFRQYHKDKMEDVFLYEVSFEGKEYVIVVGDKNILLKGREKGLLLPLPKVEKSLSAEVYQIELYSREQFEKEKDWYLYFRYKIGTALLMGSDFISRAPKVVLKNYSLERNSEVVDQPVGYIEPALQELYQGLIEDSSFDLRGYLKHPRFRVVKNNQRALRPKSNSMTGLEVNFISPFTLKPAKKENQEIDLPKVLLDPNILEINEYQKKIGLEFFARYSLRQMMHQKLYGVDDPTVRETLVLLDCLRDYVTLDAQQQYFLIPVLKKVLPDNQHFIISLMEEMAKEKQPRITDQRVQKVIQFVERMVLKKKGSGRARRPPTTGPIKRVRPGTERVVKKPQQADLNKPASRRRGTDRFKKKGSPKTGGFSRRHPLFKETWEKWVEIDAPDFDLWRFFDTVPDLSPKLKLESLVISLTRYSELSNPLKRFLGELEGLEGSQSESLKKIFKKGTQTLDECLKGARIRQSNYLQLRKLIFDSMYQVVIDVDPTQDQYAAHFFFKKLLLDYNENPDKKISSHHMVAHFFDESLAYTKYLIQKADSEENSGDKKEAYRRVLRFIGGVRHGLSGLRRLDFPHRFFDQIAKKEEEVNKKNESLSGEVSIEQDDPFFLRPLAHFMQLLDGATQRKRSQEKAIQEIKLDSEFTFKIFEDLYEESSFDELIRYFSVNPMSGQRNVAFKHDKLRLVAKLVRFSKGDTSTALQLLRYYSELKKKRKLMKDFTAFLQASVEKSFSDDVAKILTDAAVFRLENGEGFHKEHFFQMLLHVSKFFRLSLTETKLYNYIETLIKEEEGTYQFKLALKKFKRRAPVIKGLNVDERESISKLFDWYLKMLYFVQESDLEPYLIKKDLEEKLRERIDKRLENISARESQSGLRRRASSLLTFGESFSIEFETNIERPFLEGIDYLLSRNYVQGVEKITAVMKLILKEYKNARMVYRHDNIEGKGLSIEKEFSLMNRFYNQLEIRTMRQMFHSGIFSLRYIQEKVDKGMAWRLKLTDKVLQDERLNFDQKEELDQFLDRRSVRNFLKKHLPRIENIKIEGKDQEVRVYPFLDFGTGGKEGAFQIVQYAFFGTRIYDYLGYSVVEVGEGTGKGFKKKKYVAKLAQTPYVRDLYLKYFPDYFPDIKENAERFQNNHYKEKLVNQIITSFKEFLLKNAEELEGKRKFDDADELKEYARLLTIPSLTFTDDISVSDDPEKDIQLLLIEYLPDLLETEIPKTYFSNASKNGQFSLNESYRTKVRRIASLIQGKMAAEIQEGGFFEDSPQKLARKRFEKLKALSVVLNTVLRNVDYGPFVAGTSLAILDMEASFPQFFSSLFDQSLQEGDWVKLNGHQLDVKKGPMSDDQVQGLKAIGYELFDPKRAASYYFTWRLNNVFASRGDSYNAIYKPLVVLMQEFLSEFSASNDLLEETGAINDYLNHLGSNTEQLPGDVRALIEGDGLALLNFRGDVIPYEEKELLPKEASSNGQDTVTNGTMSASVARRLQDFQNTMSFQKPGDEGIETIKFDPLSAEAQAEYDKFDDAWEAFEEAGAGEISSDPVARPSSDRLTQKSNLDVMLSEEAFVAKVGAIDIRASLEIKTEILRTNDRMKPDGLTGSRLLFGRINGDQFEITKIKMPPPDPDKLLEVIQEIEVKEDVFYLGRWYFYKPKKRVPFKVNSNHLKHLSSKQVRERLLLMVTDYSISRPVVKVYGVPSEGRGNEAKTAELIKEKLIPLRSPLSSSARIDPVSRPQPVEISI